MEYDIKRHENSYLILHVTGMARFLTNRLKISFIFSGCLSNAAPIPPLMENSSL